VVVLPVARVVAAMAVMAAVAVAAVAAPSEGVTVSKRSTGRIQ